MTTLLLFRDLEGRESELAIDEGRFAPAEGLTITATLDLRSMVSIPGLADCHAHFNATSIEGLLNSSETADLDLMRRNGMRKLEAGVLLAADKGARSDDTLRYLDEPAHLRPDLEMAGGIIATPGGYYPGFAVEPTADELPAVVAEKAAMRAGWVKLIGDWPRPGRGAVPNFSEDVLSAAASTAHAAGKRIAIHSMAPSTAGMAVRAGFDSIEHGLFLNDADLDSLGARRGAWVPTIAAVEALVDMLGADSSGGRLLTEGLGRARDLLPGAAGRGVMVLAGTDLSVPHGRVAMEAERMVAYGVAAEDALAAITTAAYDHLQRPRPLAVGSSADIVCLPGDPRDDITLLSRPEFVMRSGVVVAGAGV
jgi:imidazolonepropionase-like amidohydrolase